MPHHQNITHLWILFPGAERHLGQAAKTVAFKLGTPHFFCNLAKVECHCEAIGIRSRGFANKTMDMENHPKFLTPGIAGLAPKWPRAYTPPNGGDRHAGQTGFELSTERR
jgi:hypothetical protein